MSETRAIEMAESKSSEGGLTFRFGRYAGSDGRWVRHGEFRAFYENGSVASEGSYQDGLENGPWKDFHDNGKVAAEGAYIGGKEHGVWSYYAADGALEETVEFDHGVELKRPKRTRRAG